MAKNKGGEKTKSCTKAGRCNEDICVPSKCDKYDYNHKKFNNFLMDVNIPLGEDELVEVCDKLVAAKDELNKAEAEKATAVSAFKAVEKEQEEIISDCIRTMKSKKQTVEKEVEECFNYVDGVYTLHYIEKIGEGGEANYVLENRDLTEDEKQQEMNTVLDEAKNKEDGSKVEKPEDFDELVQQALDIIREKKSSKTATIQRKLKVSPEVVAMILDELTELEYLGEASADGEPREIKFDLEENSGSEPATGEAKPQGEKA